MIGLVEGVDIKVIAGVRHFPMLVASVFLNAKTVVELGTGQGSSGDMFVKAMKITGGRVYSIDINPNSIGRERLKDAERITLIIGDSIEVGKRWDKGDIDVLYCDSDHSYARVIGELETWGRFHPKIIFIHDTNGPPPARQYRKDQPHAPPFIAAKEYAEKMGRTFINLLTPEGLGVIC